MKSLVAWWRRWLLREKRSIEKFHFPCCKVRRINCTRGRGETLLSICNKAGGLIWIFPLGLLEWSQKCVGLANCNSALVLWPQDSNSFSNSRIRVWMTWNVQQNVVCYCAGFPICHRILNRFLIFHRILIIGFESGQVSSLPSSLFFLFSHPVFPPQGLVGMFPPRVRGWAF